MAETTGLLDAHEQEWDVYYQKAILDDGRAFFPEKLPIEELEKIRRTQGSYMFANQYLNQIIPEDEMRFKKEWFRYYQFIPKNRDTIIFIDPAIGQEDHHDFTGIVVVHGDEELRWYVEIAKRMKLTPTQTVDVVFDLCKQFKPRLIGVEDVAFQKALIYLLSEEMRLRKMSIPVVGVKPPTDKTKEMKILSVLVPRMEYGRIFFNQGMMDFEHELLTFPCGSHDDIVDALSSCDELMSYPQPERNPDVRPHPGTALYETQYIKNLQRENR